MTVYTDADRRDDRNRQKKRERAGRCVKCLQMMKKDDRLHTDGEKISSFGQLELEECLLILKMCLLDCLLENQPIGEEDGI